MQDLEKELTQERRRADDMKAEMAQTRKKVFDRKKTARRQSAFLNPLSVMNNSDGSSESAGSDTE